MSTRTTSYFIKKVTFKLHETYSQPLRSELELFTSLSLSVPRIASAALYERTHASLSSPRLPRLARLAHTSALPPSHYTQTSNQRSNDPPSK